LPAARARLRRLTPAEAAAAIRAGRMLVDTRDGDVALGTAASRRGAHPAQRPRMAGRSTSGHQSAALAGHEDDLILICHEGYSSSLAAVRLHELGYENTTDVIGGFVAWSADGLPVER